MRSIEGERDPLSLLSGAAGTLAPPAWDADELDRMVQVAVIASRARRQKIARQRSVLTIAATVLLAVGAGAIAGALSTHEAPSAEPSAEAPSRIELPTGDRITRLGEGDVGIEHATSTLRQLSVSGGHTLFDVAPLEAGERFEVTTPHLRVSLVGTVFALDVTRERTRVQVFDGVVRVEAPEMEPLRLTRGDTFDSGLGRAIEGWRSPLTREGWAAARRHRARRRAVQRAPDIAPPHESPAPATAPSAARDRTPTLAQARRWLVEGETARARAAAEAACARWPRHAEWHLLLADTLRAERAHREASEAYEEAARLLPPSRATSAAYLAADLRLNALHDPAGALATLDEFGAAHPGSPIEERASALSIRARLAAGDDESARTEARRYLARFPAGPSRAWIAELVDAPSEPATSP